MAISCDQIRHAGSSFYLAALRWWQAVTQGRSTGFCIPPNKVRFRSFELRFLCQTWLGLVVSLLAAVLPWTEARAAKMRDIDGFFNKACSLAFFCYNFFMHLSPPARGGSLEFDGGFGFLVWRQKARSIGSLRSGGGGAGPASSTRHGGGGEELDAARHDWRLGCPGVAMLQTGEHTRRPLFWRPTLMTSWWSSSPVMHAGVSSTSRRRPYFELVAALHFLLMPSGLVPGAGEDGRGGSSSFTGGCGGPNCVSLILFRVLFVRSRDLLVFVFSCEVPTVICTCTAEY